MEGGGADSLGIYSSRHELCVVASELEKGQHARKHANMKADEHADAQQELRRASSWVAPLSPAAAVTFTAASLRAREWWPYRTGRHRAANER